MHASCLSCLLDYSSRGYTIEPNLLVVLTEIVDYSLSLLTNFDAVCGERNYNYRVILFGAI